VVPTPRANVKLALDANMPPALQTNPNLTTQAIAFVRSAIAIYDAEMVPKFDRVAEKINDFVNRCHAESVPDVIADNIGIFLKMYYDISMSIVASLEILVWLRLLFSATTFRRQPWIMIVLYTLFLRARYDQSIHFRTAFAQFEARAGSLLDAQDIPLIVRQAWKKA